MEDCFDLSNIQIDILTELSNIGSGSAVTALSKLTGKEVKMKVPVVNLVEFKNIANFVGGPENIIIGILVNISGDIDGMVIFILDAKSARMILNTLFSSDSMNTEFNEIEQSALLEVGNIVCSSYLGSLATMTEKKLIPSVPSISIDMANAILSVPAIEFSKISDQALFIESVFEFNNADHISGYFLFVPSADTFGIIMDKFN